ncbi:MAG: 30S ribosomal protein S20 [Clostridia bacterium]|nr:30S ribosomal protein S20 [Clostridia bacterium]
MPNIKSAKKRVIVTETKTLQNKMAKSDLRTELKKFDAAIEAGDKETATAIYAEAVHKVDKAASKNLIHKNNAAHKKSQLTKKLNTLA